MQLNDPSGEAARVVDGALSVKEQRNDTVVITHTYDCTAADTVLWIRNDRSEDFVIDRIHTFSDVSTRWTVHSPGPTTTPAGTALVPRREDLGGASETGITAYGNETGNTQANVLHENVMRANAAVPEWKPINLRLPKGKELAIDHVSASTTFCGATIEGHYEGS